MKIIFLHIPKTAGQSVHAALINAYGPEAVCPARSNTQLYNMTISELNRYQVFSGHLDWSLLDCIRGEKYIFTILREPMERILSFYFYLREDAKKKSPDELKKPSRQGMRAALEMTPNEYFYQSNRFRGFIDGHYDNFYTYYFAGRVFQGRSRFFRKIKQGSLTKSQLIDLAKQNMDELNDVYNFADIGKAFDKISEISGKNILNSDSYRRNVNTAIDEKDRTQKLIALGADTKTLTKIKDFCELDYELLNKYFQR